MSTTDLQLPERRGREGNIWVNERPSPTDLGDWFKANVRLHEGMEHDDWISGITLITQTDTVTEFVGYDESNRPILVPGVEHIFYIPYPKVETRIDYFNRLMELNADEWVGFILPVAAADPKGLPVGYTAMPVQQVQGGQVTLICYTAQVKVFKRRGLVFEEREDADGVVRMHPEGEVVLHGLPGTKSVPLLNEWGRVDQNAMMKAQTGAAGRALGMAGILVIPGTGVATAEDMQESTRAPQGAPTPTPQGESEATGGGSLLTDDQLRERAANLLTKLKEYPNELAVFQAWARDSGLKNLASIEGVALQGVVRKLERALPESNVPPAVVDLDISGADEE